MKQNIQKLVKYLLHVVYLQPPSAIRGIQRVSIKYLIILKCRNSKLTQRNMQ